MSHKCSISNWLDFGCSHGHLIEFLKEKNIDSDGIVISEVVGHNVQNKGLTIFESIENLTERKEYDVISIIASQYYCEEPINLIRGFYNNTHQNGLIILRITNRNWLAKLKIFL